MEVNIQHQAGDEDTIIISRKMSPHTNQSMVWVMTRAQLVQLRDKINGFIDADQP